MGRRRDPAKERFWRRTMTRWQRSGLSVRAFCDRQFLSEALFYAWRRKLVDGDPVPVQRADHDSRPAQFLPVQLVSEGTPDSEVQGCLEVHLPTGVRVRVPPGFDAQTLTQVFAVLEMNRC